jgi:hypothetical protein
MAQPRARGKLDIRRRSATRALNRAKLMEKGLTDHAGVFLDPKPPLPVFANQIVLTDKAQVEAAHGGRGMAAARDVQLGLLVGMMESELVYIQSVADTGNPDEAVQTLLAGGVAVALVGDHSKPILKVTQGPTEGSVVLEANATAILGADLHRKHYFNWGYTTDGKTFIALPPTPGARTTVSGLALLTTVGFRVSATTMKNGTTEWSAIVNFLVR